MDPKDLQDLMEIALRGASAVERRWIAELAQKVNAALQAPPPEPEPAPE